MVGRERHASKFSGKINDMVPCSNIPFQSPILIETVEQEIQVKARSGGKGTQGRFWERFRERFGKQSTMVKRIGKPPGED